MQVEIKGCGTSQLVANLRPVCSFGAKHGPDTPSRAKHIKRLGEAIVVNDACVDGKDPHKQDDVATSKHHVEHLQRQKKTKKLSTSTLKISFIILLHTYTCST